MVKKCKRQWGATGVRGRVEQIRPYVFEVSADASITARLSPDRRTQIELILKDRSIEGADPDGFFDALADAIGFFDLGKRLRGESLPAAVRKNLVHATDSALGLHDALNELDGNSRQLLGEVVQGGIHSLYDNIKPVIRALQRALRLAGDYPQGGGDLPEPHRFFLAADVKDAIKTHLGIRATCTKKGLFVEVLDAVLEEATRKPVKAVHELARAVIKHKVKRKRPGGIIEYVPPPNPI